MKNNVFLVINQKIKRKIFSSYRKKNLYLKKGRINLKIFSPFIEKLYPIYVSMLWDIHLMFRICMRMFQLSPMHLPTKDSFSKTDNTLKEEADLSFKNILNKFLFYALCHV